jgi:hypothetical protein
MQSLHADDIEQLKQHLTAFESGFVFRGQTNAYVGSDGLPNLNSSFIRKGCIPPLMLKWIFYTKELLRRGGLDVENPQAGHFIQGLLQHYGWRSFFVDLTASHRVAAWFASHKFASKRAWQFCENSFEEPVMLGVQTAQHTDHDGMGNLYILNIEQLEASSHELVNLVDDLTTDCITRFEVQKAWLAGLFRNQVRLDPAAITAHITAPSSVFRAFAGEAGFKSTDDLFPSPVNDKIFANLLSLPRIGIEFPNQPPPFPFYLRSLEIPEYQDSFVKHLPIKTALYSKFRLSEIMPGANDELWLRVPEETFYGDIGTGKPLPRLSEFVRANDVTNIESEGLICLPGVKDSISYEKGISLRRNGNMVEVCGISVDYKSSRLSGVGITKGYLYELVGNRLVRRVSQTDCPCGDPARHNLHLYGLAVLEDILSSTDALRSGNIVKVAMKS